MQEKSQNDTKNKKPWVKYFEPFDRAVISIAMSRSRPRGWYGYTKVPSTGKHNKNWHFFSFCKVIHESGNEAYRLIIGPFKLMFGFAIS